MGGQFRRGGGDGSSALGVIQVEHRPLEGIDDIDAGLAADHPSTEVVPQSVLFAPEVDITVDHTVGECAEIEGTRSERAELCPTDVMRRNGRHHDNRLRQFGAS